MSYHVPVRSYFPGMGEAVADRTVNRRIFTEKQRGMISRPLVLGETDPFFKEWKNAADLSGWPVRLDETAAPMGYLPELRTETWEEVAERVSLGNTMLVAEGAEDFETMRLHMRQGSVLLSGRHLQHGDAGQKDRPQEVFTNCSTAAASFLLFYLLLNGSGVGRAYDDAMMKVDWRKMPQTHIVIAADYPDRSVMEMDWGVGHEMPLIGDAFRTPEEFAHLKGNEKVVWFEVPDSRGGWAKAVELMERMAYEGKRDWILILDFSKVRCKGSPIRGMQNRPSSGPGPLMNALLRVSGLRESDMEPWEATMHADHHLAECVLVGGARRAARMATKRWDDPSIFGFIAIKRAGGLWSSNNSVTIDDEFRRRCQAVAYHYRDMGRCITDKSYVHLLHVSGVCDARDVHAWLVLQELAHAAYHDNTGEPGLINQDRLHENRAGVERYLEGYYVGSRDFLPEPETEALLRDLAASTVASVYTMITNPCGEIALLMLGGYCVIADVVPFHAADDDDAEEAFRVATRALIRTNTMDCLYRAEVDRTNRIGVGITGFHEWARARFGFGWRQIVDEEVSLSMWLTLSRFKRAIVQETQNYAARLGVVVPHTNTTFKPAGTTSKLFGLTEGAHLPSMRWYLRWVQFRNDDPLVQEYADKGYPIRRLVQYSGTTIVGFPTAPAICDIDGGDWVVTAGEATPEEQYQFLRLLEKYWIVGVEEDGITPLTDTGNQVSYTLKYDPREVDFARFLNTLIEGQFSIRCCSVMPQVDMTAYEYQPEEPITHARFVELMDRIQGGAKEDIDFAHIDCGSGGCPIDFDKDEAA